MANSNYAKGVTIARRRAQDALITVERDLNQHRVLQNFDAASQLGCAKQVLEQVVGSLSLYEQNNN